MGLFGSKKKAEEAPKEDALAGISRQLEEFQSEIRKRLGSLEDKVKKLHENSEKLATKNEVSKMGEGFARVEDIEKARKGLATVDDVANSREGLASESYVDNSEKNLRREIGSLALRVETLEKNYKNLLCKRAGCTLVDDLETARTAITSLRTANEEAAGKLKVLDVDALKKAVYEGAHHKLDESLGKYLAEYIANLSEELKHVPDNLKAGLAQYAKEQIVEQAGQLKAELQIAADDVDAKCQGVIETLHLAHHKFYFYSLSNHHQNLLVRLVSGYNDARGAENALSNPRNKNFDVNDWDQLRRMIDSAKRNDITMEYLHRAVQNIRTQPKVI
ncbi:MAG: hypothetical protein NTW67_05460 [Candidatus Woesearchaeota archaeon]|nr:hypothetical protein [Candidatus Woesearchaeota archaeon]